MTRPSASPDPHPWRGVSPPVGRKSLAALRRDLLDALFDQIITTLARSRDGP